MDGNMPRMTGGQAAVAMKEMGYTYPIVGLTALVGQDVRGVWVIMFSSKWCSRRAQAFKGIELDAVLHKPFQPAKLMPLVKALSIHKPTR
jgi:CheY-like chemotaxis protein